MSIKSSIGWCDMTLNPIKGRCKGGCWYCFYSGKRGILNRFKQDSRIYLHLPVFDKLPQKPKKIFLCSTHDLFGSWIPNVWREYIFYEIENYSQHIFQILTKFPQNIDRKMPHNVWLGVTITGEKEKWEAFNLGILCSKSAKIRFVSIEPILSNLTWNALDGLQYFNWIIIGKLTGYGHKYDPKKEWIEEIVWKARERDIPIFMKDNLKEIWGENLIQEFPE